MYFPLFVGILCLSLFCYAFLCVHSGFATILKRKRKLVALPFSWLLCYSLLSSSCMLLKMFCGSSSRCRGLVCSMWLWYFLIILMIKNQCVYITLILTLLSAKKQQSKVSKLYMLSLRENIAKHWSCIGYSLISLIDNMVKFKSCIHYTVWDMIKNQNSLSST